eukprot:2946770-Pyramimonas_sp.AAC.1
MPLPPTESEEIWQHDVAQQRVRRKERGAQHQPVALRHHSCPTLRREDEPAQPEVDAVSPHFLCTRD